MWRDCSQSYWVHSTGSLHSCICIHIEYLHKETSRFIYQVGDRDFLFAGSLSKVTSQGWVRRGALSPVADTHTPSLEWHAVADQEIRWLNMDKNQEDRFSKNCRLFIIQLRGRQMNMEGCPIQLAQSSYSTSFIHPTLPKILNNQDGHKACSSYLAIILKWIACKEVTTKIHCVPRISPL